MMHPLILDKEKESQFLKLAESRNFKLIDTPFIETLVWETLSSDDLKQMSERSVWQSGSQLYGLRNDFTDQLVRYYQDYPLQDRAVAYAGSIVRNQRVCTQLGLEYYQPSIQEIHDTFETFKLYIEHCLEDQIQYVVIGHYQLTDLLLNNVQHDSQLLTWIAQRNISELKSALGLSHPVVQLLLTPTHQQLSLLNTLFPSDHYILRSLNRWDTYFKSLGITPIHLDMTPQPPRSYYKGAFIHAHLKKSNLTLTGGYYKDTLEGFGLGLTL